MNLPRVNFGDITEECFTDEFLCSLKLASPIFKCKPTHLLRFMPEQECLNLDCKSHRTVWDVEVTSGFEFVEPDDRHLMICSKCRCGMWKEHAKAAYEVRYERVAYSGTTPMSQYIEAPTRSQAKKKFHESTRYNRSKGDRIKGIKMSKEPVRSRVLITSPVADRLSRFLLGYFIELYFERASKFKRVCNDPIAQLEI